MIEPKNLITFSISLAFGLVCGTTCSFAQNVQDEYLRLDENDALHKPLPKKPSKSNSNKTDYPSAAPAVMTDPSMRPGAQTVEPTSAMTVPNWNPPAVPQRNEIFIAPGAADRLGGFYGGMRGGPAGSFGPGRQGFAAPMLIQTGPSPSSGNYYQPSTPSSSGSGSYYSSGAPWQTPVISNPTTKDYWGPDGNPFQKKQK